MSVNLHFINDLVTGCFLKAGWHPNAGCSCEKCDFYRWNTVLVTMLGTSVVTLQSVIGWKVTKDVILHIAVHVKSLNMLWNLQ